MPVRSLGALLALLVAWPCQAAAEPASQPASIPSSRPVTRSPTLTAAAPPGGAASRSTRPALRSRGTARILALTCTLVPLTVAAGVFGHAMRGVGHERELWASGALGVVGLGFGPSAGHFYAGEYFSPAGHVVLRTGLAAGGAALIAFAFLQNLGEALGSLFGGPQPRALTASDMAGPLTIGGLFVAGAVTLAVYDLYDAARAVDRTNAARLRKGMVVAPFVVRGAGGPQYGLAIAGAL
jgi:hypothetical protein